MRLCTFESSWGFKFQVMEAFHDSLHALDFAVIGEATQNVGNVSS